MTTTPKPTIPGSCGIHIFADPGRARARTCDVCAWAVASALAESKAPKFNRNWTEEHRAKMATRMDAQKRAMQGHVSAHRAERNMKATADAHAAETTATMRNAVSGRFERVVEPPCVACQGSDGAIHSCGRYYRGALGNGDNGFAETG